MKDIIWIYSAYYLLEQITQLLQNICTYLEANQDMREKMGDIADVINQSWNKKKQLYDIITMAWQ